MKIQSKVSITLMLVLMLAIGHVSADVKDDIQNLIKKWKKNPEPMKLRNSWVCRAMMMDG